MEIDLDGSVKVVNEGRQQQAGGHGTAEAAASLGGHRVGGGFWAQEARVQQQVQHAGQVGAQKGAQVAYQGRHSPQGGLNLQLLPLACSAIRSGGSLHGSYNTSAYGYRHVAVYRSASKCAASFAQPWDQLDPR